MKLSKSHIATALAAMSIMTGVNAASIDPAMPHLQTEDGKTRLIVDGNPYLILGGQIHNSSTANPEDLTKALNVVAALQANVAEVPIYWEAIEKQPGHYDFGSIDLTLQEARKRGLRLVFLWFGSWKNGESHYSPEWVKQDKKKFERVIGSDGQETEIISPLSQAALDADSQAFAAVMRHIRSVDGANHTVLMMQVENEPGLLGTDRDYSPAATRLFDDKVPDSLMHWLSQHRASLSPAMSKALAAGDDRSAGSWREVFGPLAAEAFTAWNVSHYVDRVAAAGKQEYPLPFYSNAWLVEGVERAGRWPSGGATDHVIDIWKANAPAIDILAPDIYYPKFNDHAVPYSRPDNVLWVPEVNFQPYFVGFIYSVFGDYNGIGFTPFGVDDVAKGGTHAAIGAMFQDSYQTLRPLLPLIAKYQYTGAIHPILQGIGRGEDWKMSIPLGDQLAANVDFTIPFSPEEGRAKGMIVELAKDDFLVVGNGYKVVFRELEGPLRDAQLLSIEEGSFQGAQWVPVRRLNGDERHVELPGDHSTVLRVRVNH